MFIDENEIIDICVYYKKNGKRYEAYTASELKELPLEDDEREKYSTLSVKMKILTWGLYNTLQEAAMVDDGRGIGEKGFNYQIYKENRLIKLLSQWDAKNEDGSPVPIERKSVCRLSPAIAEAILRAYDEESFLDGESEKN